MPADIAHFVLVAFQAQRWSFSLKPRVFTLGPMENLRFFVFAKCSFKVIKLLCSYFYCEKHNINNTNTNAIFSRSFV